MAVQGGPNIVEDGLILYMDAANPRSYISGSSIAYSLKENVTGSLDKDASTVIFSTDNQGIWEFNLPSNTGENDQINMGHQELYNFDRLNPFSMSVWAKATVSSGFGFGLLSQLTTGILTPGWIFFIDWRTTTNPVLKLSLCHFQGGSNTLSAQSEEGEVLITTNTWNQYAATYNGNSSVSGCQLYINGTAINTTINHDTLTSSSITSTAVQTTLGTRYNNGLDYIGEISSATIYNRELSAAEIQQNYNALKGRFEL